MTNQLITPTKIGIEEVFPRTMAPFIQRCFYSRWRFFWSIYYNIKNKIYYYSLLRFLHIPFTVRFDRMTPRGSKNA